MMSLHHLSVLPAYLLRAVPGVDVAHVIVRGRICTGLLAGLAVVMAGMLAGEDNAEDRQTVRLQSPLTTMISAAEIPPHPLSIQGTIICGQDAPKDLALGAFAGDGHGRWYRSQRSVSLHVGRNHVVFDLSPQAAMICEPARSQWGGYEWQRTTQAGFFLWSTSRTQAQIDMVGLKVLGGETPPAERSPGLRDLTIAGMAATGVVTAQTGKPWSLHVRPYPFPSEPFDPECFSLDAVITAPDGHQQRIGGFYRQPLVLENIGVREIGIPTVGAYFEVRYRPELPGTYTMHLEISGREATGMKPTLALPDMVVSGAPWDDYVRVDPTDPRFFCTGSRLKDPAFFWSIGLNLHAVWDERGRQACHTRLTPNLLWQGYERYLMRFAAAGGNCVEIWLCSWGLGLEWNGAWTEFHGTGRYSDENAERLDRVFTLAEKLGIRVNLVINNHGQGSDDTDKEWPASPWNARNGGPFDRPDRLFYDPTAAAGQERYRRYIIARWADSPALLGWKLWSEQNLTAGGGRLFAWHQQAAKRWKELDPYGHGITTHWSGDYHCPDRRLVALPDLDYICIDAYHGQGTLLAQLVWDGLNAPDGLGGFNKPVMITEYGGDSQGCPTPQMIAEQLVGPWAAMVSGSPGSPMLWWFEWVDQRDHWSTYGAIRRFMAGEDLRGSSAHVAIFAGSSPDGAALWARGWHRPGRMLGYVLDYEWGLYGRELHRISDATIHIGDSIKPGAMAVEWWDAESGTLVSKVAIDHPGGALDLHPPPFTSQLAFKLYRTASAQKKPD